MSENGRSAENQASLATSFLYGGNGIYIESQYEKWLSNPNSVDKSWADFFANIGQNDGSANSNSPSWARKDWPPRENSELIALIDGDWSGLEVKAAKKPAAKADAPADSSTVLQATRDSIKAIMMIRAFRIRGHLAAKLDPLGLDDFRETQPELDPATYGFTDKDMDRPIFIDFVLGLEYATPRQMLEILQRTYCSTLGLEFMHVSNPEEKNWLQARMEGPDKGISFTPEGKKAILNKIIETQGFEQFVHKRYPGTKRFGLDGGESLIPAMEQIIKRGGNLGVADIVLGMPHRGRLNVLSTVMGKPYHVIFHEFSGGSATPDDVAGSGDVKYHMGASSDRSFDGNDVHLSLTPNPSHLEIVNPVVLGKVRAKMTQHGGTKPEQFRKVMPLLLHGDAAFAGQGVVAECFALTGVKGHRTGGTVHFIVNNQIGFTTAPKFSRSSPYPSDVALMVQAPIFHVNGDDPEAVVFAAKVATEYRQEFNKDVVIDMFCYRRFGHNEGDDPTMTNPIMYSRIKDQPSTLDIYAARLIAEGIVTRDEVDKSIADFSTFLEDEFQKGKIYEPQKADWLDGVWTGLGLPDSEDRRGDTGVSDNKLMELGTKITQIPTGFNMHKTVERVVGVRRTMIETGENIDWAMGEHLAFASLLDEGFPIRLSGQDSCRGTFSHRHSHFIDQITEDRYTPLANLGANQAEFEVIDSALSEEAILGYEYGHSLGAPNTLTMWEGQFGDFANGAQVVIDQFICSGERKWLRMSGLVMLLPHGYEGQGPEHSSARLERYLQLCAEDNLQIVNCTTPANFFHVLRRQIHRKFRKPLIVMTPKSLLRHKKCVSNISEFGPNSSFHRVLWDDAEHKKGSSVALKADKDIKRVILCSGKVYFDLFDAREKKNLTDIQIIRVEQLYPFPAKSMITELSRFKNAEIVWCQEEPKNMGAWSFMEPNIEWVLDKIGAKHKRARYAGRSASASTAAGLMSKHLRELETFLNEALD
ncbi:MAG: 2-oxoglutarate dehydrogenase E1 component [Hyphomonadaceae bacterium]|nr:MAG: 2-oxoglutarate dehydrogenase E1 component [Hyphomonadaceae bacterium]